MARPNTRARLAVSKRLKTPGPSHATSKALSRVQPPRVECLDPAPGRSTRSTHQGSPVPHGLLPGKQIYTRDSGSPAVLVENSFSRFEALKRTVAEQSQTIIDQRSMIDSVVRMHEGLRRQVVQAHPSFPLPDITLHDAPSPQQAVTIPNVIYAATPEALTDAVCTPAVATPVGIGAPLAASTAARNVNISPVPAQPSSNVIMNTSAGTPTLPKPSTTLAAGPATIVANHSKIDSVSTPTLMTQDFNPVITPLANPTPS
ncbi:hypothetical protein M405DRAFT_867319 [Rhizopogon salebrosus TDB-379]|nr:hypothetical protein M405DRAFT_867319 [Rhizopogon salebrosus TDB-379]